MNLQNFRFNLVRKLLSIPLFGQCSLTSMVTVLEFSCCCSEQEHLVLCVGEEEGLVCFRFFFFQEHVFVYVVLTCFFLIF